MLQHSLTLLVLLVAVSWGGCTTRASNEMDAGTEPDAGIPDASLPEPTGFFQVAEVGERWLLITPEGEPFYSIGVNHVTANNNTDRETGICPYCDAVAAHYDSHEDWAEATAARLDSWGFNTIGATSTRCWTNT
jgi:hypothetical protein